MELARQPAGSRTHSPSASEEELFCAPLLANGAEIAGMNRFRYMQVRFNGCFCNGFKTVWANGLEFSVFVFLMKEQSVGTVEHSITCAYR